MSHFIAYPFIGELNRINQFYKWLGIDVEGGMLSFKEFNIFFGGEEFGINNFQLVIQIDKSVSDFQSELEANNIVPLESGFDASGPFYIITDPAGIQVRVGFSSEALSKSI